MDQHFLGTFRSFQLHIYLIYPSSTYSSRKSPTSVYAFPIWIIQFDSINIQTCTVNVPRTRNRTTYTTIRWNANLENVKAVGRSQLSRRILLVLLSRTNDAKERTTQRISNIPHHWVSDNRYLPLAFSFLQLSFHSDIVHQVLLTVESLQLQESAWGVRFRNGPSLQLSIDSSR